MAKILGVDVARQGDDASVLARRRGLQMYPFKKYRNLTGIEGASITNRLWNEFGADAAFVDGTGGFGFAWIDQLSNLGRTAIPIGFADQARDSVRYYNRRAEMSIEFVEWIKNGGALPPEGSEGAVELLESLIHTTYGFKGDRLILEAKEDVKAKIGFSPDEFDASILTFAEPVTAKRATGHISHNVVQPYSPFTDLERRTGGGYSAVGDYRPFG
jgi:phage terminase large subunit